MNEARHSSTHPPADAGADNSADLHVTIDVMGLRLQSRDDLSISLQVYGGETCYLIEDPLSSRFYRVGVTEYTLLSLLDGDRTIADAMARTAELTGQHAMSEEATIAYCKWLVDSGLAATAQSASGGRLAEAAEQSHRERWAARLTPLFQRLPLARPDELAEHFRPLAAKLFSTTGALVWTALVALGACSIWLRWDAFAAGGTHVLSPSNWIYLAGAWLTLKMVHESAHALACKRYRGEVKEAGFMLVLFAPLPYVDVTSAWRFDSKWKRMTVSAAGMMAELAVAAVAAWVWAHADSPSIRQTAQNIVVTAAFMTLVFNANPLMRFDGYYLLVDLLEAPNLSTHGSQWIRRLLRRLLFGEPAPAANWPEHRTWLVATYGIAALIWRVFVCLVLVILAESMFFGAGVVLAILAVAAWLMAPLAQFVKALRQHPDIAARRRAGIVLSSLGAAVAAAWVLIPCYSPVTAPAVVDHWPLTRVRARSEGFVERVAVVPGQHVQEGQLLVQLSNAELELEAEQLRLEIEHSRQRSRNFRAHEDIASLQIEDRNRQALEDRLESVHNELAHLVVRAAVAGHIVELPLQWQEGTLVLPGAPLVAIGRESDKQLHVMVSQEHLEAFQSRTKRQGGFTERSLAAHIWGVGTTRVSLDQVNPRGTTTLRYPALAALAGGPLEVQPRRAPLDAAELEGAGSHEANGDSAVTAQWELTTPHFWAVASGASLAELRAGQTGFVRFWRFEGTLGKVLMQRFTRWTEARRQQARSVQGE
ncbi:MAG: efflux RND transporter periplasmic adaptor subunit [Planctomycetales bacterium]|nr:efflux RND transporter periplasmic adaptor subunit [Planctomycetales bacterium]